MKTAIHRLAVFSALASPFVLGCSSLPPVQKQQYAQLRNTRAFDFEFPVVWKGIEKAFENYRVAERDPAEVGLLEMRKLSKRTLETDWIYSESRDKYVEYRLNDLPRRKYLEVRLKYKINAERTLGGTQVGVDLEEEVANLKADGTSKGFSGTDQPDTSRQNEILDKIQSAILAAQP